MNYSVPSMSGMDVILMLYNTLAQNICNSYIQNNQHKPAGIQRSTEYNEMLTWCI